MLQFVLSIVPPTIDDTNVVSYPKHLKGDTMIQLVLSIVPPTIDDTNVVSHPQHLKVNTMILFYFICSFSDD